MYAIAFVILVFNGFVDCDVAEVGILVDLDAANFPDFGWYTCVCVEIWVFLFDFVVRAAGASGAFVVRAAGDLGDFVVRAFDALGDLPFDAVGVWAVVAGDVVSTGGRVGRVPRRSTARHHSQPVCQRLNHA